MSSSAEIIRLATAYADAAGSTEPTGQQWMTAAVAAGVPAASVRSAAEVAMHEWLSRPLATTSAPGSLKPRADALRAKIAHLEKQAPAGRSIIAKREELARLLAIDPAA